MDLFLSAQSVGVLALVTASCMVAAGAIGTGLSRRRARARRDGVPPADPPERLVPLRESAVAGRLRVDGSCCARLEDAVPVAASSYLRNAGDRTAAWCERAGSLWLEAGGRRITLEGTLLVEVGSEEQYPAVALEKLRGRVIDRVYDATAHGMSRRKGIARHGVFRSLRCHDDVVVVGVVERCADEDAGAGYRDNGSGWRLRPGSDGVLVACYRRRPRIRGAFGRVQLWAAALVGCSTTLLIGSFAAGVQPSCSPGGSACMLDGTCGARLELDATGPEVVCVAKTDADCSRSISCSLTGACRAVKGRCVPTHDRDCRQSRACRMGGRCTLSPHGQVCIEDEPARTMAASPRRAAIEGR